MSKHKTVWNESTYHKRIEEGRGQGEVRQYLPWVQVQDFSSQGTISRVAGHKTGRTHHFMSSGETDYYMGNSGATKRRKGAYPASDFTESLYLSEVSGAPVVIH